MKTSTFVALLASPDDIPRIAELQYQACGSDPGFSSIFGPPTAASLAHLARQYGELLNDPTALMTIVKDTSRGEIVGYSIWHFIGSKQPESVEEEMVTDIDATGFPADANVKLGQRLIKSSVRKRNEVATECFGIGQPYMYLGVIGTNPDYQKQGAASKLMELGLEQASKRKLPIYVESSPAAYALYKKFGFQTHDQLPLDLRPEKEGYFVNMCMIKVPYATQ